MNKQWSDINKQMQKEINSKATFKSGIETLFFLRNILFQQLTDLRNNISPEDYSKMPFKNAKGYHNKTIAYSIWHIFRIEDIVAHTIINNDEQVFFAENFQEKINSPIITTGNELTQDEVENFSKKLNIPELYNYAQKVKNSTEELLCNLEYADLKKKPSPQIRENLINSNCVSNNENAFWLVDYWCNKDVKGLIKMPFSRHHIMHIEAILRIKNKI